jgi:hypothetical protein
MNISTTDTTSRDNIITETLRRITPSTRRFANTCGLEFDDCIQEAALTMVQVWHLIPADCANIHAYLRVAAQHALYKAHPPKEMTVLSLDRRDEDDDIPLADRIADKVDVLVEQDNARVDALISTMHAALRCLPLPVQEYARKRFEIFAYEPTPPSKKCARWGKPSDAYSMYSKARAMQTYLSRDPQVQALVQREMAVL